MYIRISDSVSLQRLTILERRALTMLAESHEEGYHVIGSSRGMLKQLAILEDLPESTKIIYRNLYSTYTTTIPLEDHLDFYCIAEQGNFPPQKKLDGNIHVSLEWLSHGSLRKSTHIIGENLNDCLFYFRISEVFISRNLRGYTPSAELVPGGGTTTHQPFAMHQKNNIHFSICIVDSDCNYPGKPLGQTAKLVKAVDDPKMPITNLMILNFMEIENIVPASLITPTGDNNKDKSLELIKIVRSRDIGKSMFLDLKKGLTLSKLKSLSGTSQEKDFFREIHKSIIQISDVPSYTNNPKSDLWALYPLGDKVLVDVISREEFKDVRTLSALISREGLDDVWIGIGRVVAAWCIAAHRNFVS